MTARAPTTRPRLNVTFGGFAVGGIFEYYDNGGDDNNAWVAGGGASYGVDAWTVGMQGSHGTYDGSRPAAATVTAATQPEPRRS